MSYTGEPSFAGYGTAPNTVAGDERLVLQASPFRIAPTGNGPGFKVFAHY